MLFVALLMLIVASQVYCIRNPPIVALCAIVKGENLYLHEWITFHRGVGFDYVYIFDNSDANDLISLSDTYPFVTVYHMPGAGKQLQAYYTFTEAFRIFDIWAAFFDVDEFLVLKKQSTVQELIADCCIGKEDIVEGDSVVKGSALSINWVLFVSNHHTEYSLEPVVQRFTTRDRFLEPHVKTIAFLPHVVNFFNAHYPQLKHDLQQVDTRGRYFTGPKTNHTAGMLVEEEKVAVLHHYFTKSEEEFRLKIARGRSDLAHKKRVMEDFAIYDHNEVADSSACDLYQSVMLKPDDNIDIDPQPMLYVAVEEADVSAAGQSAASTASSVDYAAFDMLFDSDPSPPSLSPPVELYWLDVKLTQRNHPLSSVPLVIFEHERSYLLLAVVRFCVDHQLQQNACATLMNALTRYYNLELDAQSVALFDRLFQLCPAERGQQSVPQPPLATNDNDDVYEQCHSGYWTDTTNSSDFHMYIVSHDEASERLVLDALLRSRSSQTDENPSMPPLLSSLRIESSVFFEYLVYRTALPFLYLPYHVSTPRSDWRSLRYVAITTYKTFARYPSLCHGEVSRLLSVGLREDYDVLPLVRSGASLMVGATFSHGRAFRAAWDALLQELGYNLTTIRRLDHISPFYRNSMIVKPQWLARLTVFLSRAMEAVLFSEKLAALFSHPGRYEDYSDLEVARRIFNASAYQLHPFVFERLPSFFFAAEGARVCQGGADCGANTVW